MGTPAETTDKHDPDRWHDGPEAIAEDWTVPCEYCGKPVKDANSCAEMVVRAGGTEEAGTGRVAARKAWCDEDACVDDMISGFDQAWVSPDA